MIYVTHDQVEAMTMGDRITGRSSTVRQYNLEENIDVYFDMSELHFFDAANGLRIR